MLFAKKARMLAKENRPKDATLQELLEETRTCISQAVEDGEYSTVVIIRRFTPKDVRMKYKLKMRNKLGYRLCCEWDDKASIIHIRW